MVTGNPSIIVHKGISRPRKAHRWNDDSDDSAVICCELTEKVSLEAVKGEFVALSYAAGSPRDTRRILVNGYWFNAFQSLTKHLENLVAQMRPRGSVPLLWTDQTCTNQSDDTEKVRRLPSCEKSTSNPRRLLSCSTLNQ